jgi:hypothetical protein
MLGMAMRPLSGTEQQAELAADRLHVSDLPVGSRIAAHSVEEIGSHAYEIVEAIESL